MTPTTLKSRRAVLVGGVLLATSCGVGAPLDESGNAGGASDGVGSGASDAGGAEGEGQAATSSDPGRAYLDQTLQTLKDNAVEDPRSITGATVADSVPEITPLADPSTPQLPATVTDYEGTEVTVADTSRILALDMYGTLAEIVVGLGWGENLVGRVASSTSSSLIDLPLVTQNGHDLNVEAILALEPTVVLMDTTNGPIEVTEQLRSAGVTVVHFTPDRVLGGIRDHIEGVAAALGVAEDGVRLADRVEADLDYVITEIAEVAPADLPHKVAMSFLYVRGTAGIFFVLGNGSGADDLITALAGRDVATETGAEGVIPANSEALVNINPDLILTMTDGVESTGGLEGFFARPGVAQTTAGENQRVVTMADGQILAFGPNTPAVLASLATAIYAPDAVQGA